MNSSNLRAQSLTAIGVLVVEDQGDTRRMLQDMLIKIGVGHVHVASDGLEAMAQLEQNIGTIDLILCDWLMPRMSGIDLLRRVRMMYPTMPFIMQTGNATLEAVKEARIEGVTAFIVKPFSMAEMEVKIRLACREILNARRQPMTVY